MRILFTCGREPDYPRNAVIRQMLGQSHDVIEITDSSRRLVVRYARLALRLSLSRQPYDLAFVGFLGHPLMLLVPLVTRRPILFDMFISIYDTLCLDRRWFPPTSPIGRLAFWLDTVSTRRAAHVLVDTDTHADYLATTFRIPRAKISRLFVGCDEQIFSPRVTLPIQHSTVKVLYYSSLLPLHGLDIILHTAKRLESQPQIEFKIIGDGLTASSTRQLARRLDLRTVEWTASVPLAQLPDEIERADICLGGHFSAIPKAARVIAGKTFQCIAMGKPTIVGENPANHELLTHGHDAYFCPMADPDALAESILALAQDAELRDGLGRNARQTFLARCSTEVLSQSLNELVARLAG